MALIQRQAAQTIEEETSRFMDANFGGLDLSSFPQLQPPPPETSPLDDRFSKPYSSFHGLDSSRLREFLSAPDADALADLATADPEMAERVEDKVAQEAAEEFVRSNPDYLRTDLNFQTILDYLTNQYRSRDVDEFEDTDDAIRALVRVNAWTMTELTKAYRPDTSATAPYQFQPTASQSYRSRTDSVCTAGGEWRCYRCGLQHFTGVVRKGSPLKQQNSFVFKRTIFARGWFIE